MKNFEFNLNVSFSYFKQKISWLIYSPTSFGYLKEMVSSMSHRSKFQNLQRVLVLLFRVNERSRRRRYQNYLIERPNLCQYIFQRENSKYLIHNYEFLNRNFRKKKELEFLRLLKALFNRVSFIIILVMSCSINTEVPLNRDDLDCQIITESIRDYKVD